MAAWIAAVPALPHDLGRAANALLIVWSLTKEKTKMMAPSKRTTLVLLIFVIGAIASVNGRFILQPVAEIQAQDKPNKEAPPLEAGPWGDPVDGLSCRLVMQPRYVIGQAISAVIEVKNTSNKKRYAILDLDPFHMDSLTLEVIGPNGKLKQRFFTHRNGVGQPHHWEFKSIEPGEVKRFEVHNLGNYFDDLWPYRWWPDPTPKAHPVPTGKYTVQFRFRSEKTPPRFVASWTFEKGKKIETYKEVPPEVAAGQWANQAASTKVSFELAPLAKDDLVVHEWGVFTVFNDVKYANVNRKEEWGSLPSFFYRQFPKERLRWVPSAWDKPIIYFYAKPTPLNVTVHVKFPEGAPVVWWPAVASPVDDSPGGNLLKMPRPLRSLVWTAWIGDKAPIEDHRKPLVKVEDFPLPADCWVRQARLPGASRLTVVGNIEGPPKVRFPGGKDRLETEGFLYYDGLVPAPDYLRCEKLDRKSVTLRNHATFDITRLFVVDRRAKESVGFAFMGGPSQGFKAGTSVKIDLRPIAAKDWRATGVKQARQALLDAGLFEAEVESLLKIWDKRFFEAEGVTAFHILPGPEYDRMLPLAITPEPAAKPMRVGIALHPHVEIEPVLTEQVGALIRRLDSPQFATRQAADKALLEIGPLAIAMLQAELKKDLPLETSRRIQAVLDRVDASVWLNFPAPQKKAK